MEFITSGHSSLIQSIVLTVLGVYYVAVLVSLFHLILKTNYTLTERLLWMLVLWLVPILGAAAYWVIWNRRDI